MTKGTGEAAPMTGTTSDDIPDPNIEAAAQTAVTPAEAAANLPIPRIQQTFLGQDLSADLSDMVQESGRLVFGRLTVSAFNAVLKSAVTSKERAEDQLEEERRRSQDLSERLSTAEQERAVLQERLRGARESGTLRTITNTLGGAAVGLIPFAAEKSGWVGGIIAGVFGVALLIGTFAHKSKSDR